MQKLIIGIINTQKEKKTLKEIIEHALESSDLDYQVSTQREFDEDIDEERISEAIKNVADLKVELNNVDYFA